MPANGRSAARLRRQADQDLHRGGKRGTIPAKNNVPVVEVVHRVGDWVCVKGAHPFKGILNLALLLASIAG